MKKRAWPDIGYNFVAGSDGRIYEGVGFRNQSHHPYGYTAQSMVLAFVGRFQIRAPTPISLKAARQLFKCLQRRFKLKPSYSLYPLNYFVPSYPYPGKELKDLLANWNHFEGVIFAQRSCPLSLDAILLRYVSSPACFLLLLLIGLSYCYVSIFRHCRWCPTRERDSRLQLSDTLLCDASQRSLLMRNMRLLPAHCTLRQADIFQLQPGCTEVVLLGLQGASCGCLQQLELMWLHCCLSSDPHFPRRVAKSLALRACGDHTVLALSRRLYVLHFPDPNHVLQTLRNVVARRCVCLRAFVRGELVLLPPLTSISAQVAKKKQEVREMSFTTVQKYQRFFQACGDHTAEISYQHFQENELLQGEGVPWLDDQEPLIHMA